jgi:hypothetical protein
MVCEGDGGGERKMRTTSERNLKVRGILKVTKSNSSEL